MQTISFLYQDDDMAVIEKPSGMVVNRADTVTEFTIQDWWQEYLASHPVQPTSAEWQSLVPDDFPSEYGSPEEIFAQRGGVVHRLDKETSGVLVLAKNPGSLAALLKLFRVREVSKKYICLVHGKFQVKSDVLKLPLGRSVLNRTKFTVDAEGRVAETKYQVVEEFANLDYDFFIQEVKRHEAEQKVEQSIVKGLKKKISKAYQGFSLVECWPKTGRTHQIRVHLAHVKHPLVGDNTYLGKKRASNDSYWCPRLFLHAAELSLEHPRTHQPLTFTSPLPEDLKECLKYLK
jgi:23S rRNA pseudouridine1911/1915/1917 synthase